MRKLVFIFALLVGSAFASDFYYAQTAAGSNNGTNCANAYAYNDGTNGWNTAGKQAAGNILHVCGVFVFGAAAAQPLTISHSGTSGNPITIKFETGSGLTAANFSSAAIGGSNISWIVIDGGTNGVVQNTLNGDTGATCQAGPCTSHVADTQGIAFTSCTNCEIKNLTVNNIYIEVPQSSGGSGSAQTGAAIAMFVNSTNSHIHNNVLGSARAGILISQDSGGSSSGLEIDHNTISDGNHLIEGGGSGATETALNVLIHDNDISGWSNWVVGTNCTGPFHEDGIIWFNFGAAPTANYKLIIYNNYIHGDLTNGCPTAFIYPADDMTADIFNNVLQSTSNASGHNQFGIMWLGQGGGDGSAHSFGQYMNVWNNTILAGNSADACYNFNLSVVGGSDFRNNICYSTVGSLSYNINTYITTVGTTAALFGNWDYNDWLPVNTSFWGSQANGTHATHATWNSSVSGGAGDAHSISVNPNLNAAPFATPISGSPVISNGVNLTSLCSGVDAPLCTGPPQTFGATGSCGTGCLARSASAAWDMGAFPFSSGGGTVATPTFSPVAGTYTGTQSVSINTATGGATLCYTTDGSTPTANGAGTCTHGTTYTTAVSVAVSETLQAVGSLSGDTDSAVGSAAYVIQIATPTFSPVAGTYGGTQNVSVTSSTSGASICYTIDGTTPTATTPGTCSHGTTLASGGTVSVAVSETVKALGTKSGTTNSSVASAAYVILSFTASPAIIPAHHAGNITLTLTGVATSWTGSTAFSVSCGTLIGKSNISATSETLTVTTSSVCTMTITDTTDSVSSTISVATATISVVPTSTNISTTPTLTITGVNTLWTSETPAGLFTVTGGTGSSIGTPTVNTDTSATVVLTAGSAIATETITDTSTTATDTVAVLGEVLTIIVNGTGSVTSSPSGINCPGTCSATFVPKALITLTPSGGSLNSFSQGCAGVSCVFNIVSNTSVTALFGCGGSSPACFKNSSDAVIVQNQVAGCNSLIVAALCGSATTNYSISGNVVSISVPNSFGSYAIVGVSGCSAATQLNGLHFVTNSTTTGSVVSGNVYNSQGTLITLANVSSTAETKCYLQGQGWQPWVLAPFPAPGTTGCVNGNGQPSCTPPSIAVPSVGTWALDWSTPQAGAGPNNAPAVCWVQVADQSFAGNGNTFGTTASGESNDPIVSFNDGAGGYFYTMVFGGTSRQVHGHIDPNYCGTGVAGFVADVTAIAGSYTTGNLGGYGSFSRNPNEGPGVNQANWYFISVPTFADNFHPKLEYVTLTYAAGAVTANAPTVIADISVSCSGFQYTQIGNGLNDQVSQFKVDNRPLGSHRFSFGLGTGNQGTITRNTTFEYDQATGVCVTRDFAGYAGTNVNSVHVSAQTGAGGYALTDTLGVSQSGCTATFQPATLGTSNKLATVNIVSGGTGCSNALGVAVTGGSGTGGTVDITGIGTQGAKGTIWPYQATSPLTSPWDSFGMHSGNCDLSLAYCDVSGADTTPDGANCTTVHGGFPGYTGGCTTVSWAWQDTNPSHMLMQYTGHGQIGCKYQGYADSGIIDRGLGPDLNGTRFGIFAWGSIDPTTAFTSPHGSWPDPNCNQSLPVLLTMGPNVPAQETNPPNYTAAYGEAYLGVMKDSTSAVNDTRWFTRYYSNVDPLCGSNNVFGIWEMSPDGVFVIAPSNMNGVPTGSASTYPYSGNTGMGVDNNGQCFTGMFSVMLNAQSFGSQIVQAPVNPVILGSNQQGNLAGGSNEQ